jgi:hypothetical protein
MPSSSSFIRGFPEVLTRSQYESYTTVILLGHTSPAPIVVVWLSRFSTGEVGGIGTHPLEKLCCVGLQHLPADETIEVLPFATGLDHTGTHELLDVMRDRRLRHGKLVSQVLAGATLLVSDGLEYGHPSGVGQGLGNELELSGRQGGPR